LNGEPLNNESNFLDCLENDSYFSENNFTQRKPNNYFNKKPVKKSAFHSMKFSGKLNTNFSNDENKNPNIYYNCSKSSIKKNTKSENFLVENKKLKFPDSENISQIEANNINSSKRGFFPLSLNYDISFNSNNIAAIKLDKENPENKYGRLKPIITSYKKKRNSPKHKFSSKIQNNIINRNLPSYFNPNKRSSSENNSYEKNRRKEPDKLYKSPRYQSTCNGNKSKYIRNDSAQSLNNIITSNPDCKDANVVLLDFEKDEFVFENLPETQMSNIAIDYECLNEISGGDYSFERELITIFLTEFPDKLNQLKNALDNSNFPEIQILSHSLKSTAAMVGIKILHRKFLKIENAIKNNSVDSNKLNKFKDFVSMLNKNFKYIKKTFLQKYHDIDIKMEDSPL